MTPLHTAMPQCRSRGLPIPRGLELIRAAGLPVPDGEPFLHNVVQAVIDGADISRDALRGPGRFHAHTLPRQIGMWVAFHTTLRSQPDIAHAFGRIDHTTVIHAVRATHERLEAGGRYGRLTRQLATAVLNALDHMPSRTVIRIEHAEALEIKPLPPTRPRVCAVAPPRSRVMPTHKINALRARRWSVLSIARYLDLPPEDVAEYLGVPWGDNQEERRA